MDTELPDTMPKGTSLGSDWICSSSAGFGGWRSADSRTASGSVEESFLHFLGVAQSSKIDFLPIMLNYNARPLPVGGSAEIEEKPVSSKTSYTFKRLWGTTPPLRQGNRVLRDVITMQALATEVAVLGNEQVTCHPNIVKLEGITWDIERDSGQVWPVLAFESANRGDLFSYMTDPSRFSLPVDDRFRICISVGHAILWMHSSSIIHGDVKPQNVVIHASDAGTVVRVIDFGCSQPLVAPDDVVYIAAATPLWVAPEWHPGDFSTDAGGAKKMDVYSFGLLVLWLLFFNRGCGQTDAKFFDELMTGRDASQFALQELGKADHIPDPYKQRMAPFFARTLARDPKARCGDFLDVLKLLAGEQYVDRLLAANPLPRRTEAFITDDASINFQLLPSLIPLYQADYRVRAYIAHCLRYCLERADAGSMRCLRLSAQLSVCYKLGFGVPRDENEAGVLWDAGGLGTRELEHFVSQIQAINSPPGYWAGGSYVKLALGGHDITTDVYDYYASEGLVERAIEHLFREISYVESGIGHDCFLAEVIRISLQDILRGSGNLDEAAQVGEAIVSTLIKQRGIHDQDTLSSRANLAAIRIDAGDWNKAEESLEDIHQCQIATLGNTHPDTLSTSRLLARAFERQGRIPEARSMLEEVIAAEEAAFGKTHDRTLDSKTMAASLLLKDHRFKEAEERLMEVIQARQSTAARHKEFELQEVLEQLVSGKRCHPDLPRDLRWLAAAYHYQGRYVEAERIQQVLSSHYESTLGTEHPNSVLSRGDLVATMAKSGHTEESLAIFEGVLLISKRIWGAESRAVLDILGHMCASYMRCGNLGRAGDLAIERLQITQRGSFPGAADSSPALEAIVGLVKSHLEQADQEKAASLLDAIPLDKFGIITTGQTIVETLAALEKIIRSERKDGALVASTR